MKLSSTAPFSHLHKGAALVVSMVMLLVITVIGIAVMGGSRLEWLMTNNSHLQTDAYRNAEIALVAGLNSIVNPPINAPLPPPIPVSTLSPQDLADVTKWNDGTIVGIPVATTTGTAAYVQQYLGCSELTASAPLDWVNNTCNDAPASHIFAHTYRVWALGTDGKGAARILQSTRILIYNQTIYTGLPGPLPSGKLPSLDNRVELQPS
jgi:hypothetical protein